MKKVVGVAQLLRDRLDDDLDGAFPFINSLDRSLPVQRKPVFYVVAEALQLVSSLIEAQLNRVRYQ